MARIDRHGYGGDFLRAVRFVLLVRVHRDRVRLRDGACQVKGDGRAGHERERVARLLAKDRAACRAVFRDISRLRRAAVVRQSRYNARRRAAVCADNLLLHRAQRVDLDLRESLRDQPRDHAEVDRRAA